MAKYKDLVVWQKSIDLVENMYKATQGFPKEEMYGLVSQMRRSSISIPSNIAEGSGRASRKEYLHFLSIAFASCCEIETQSIIAKKLNYISAETASHIQEDISGIGRMLNALQKSLRTSAP
jgi:four helix bundle protein